jgi:ATP phosphoribosyltransferase
MSEEKRLKIAIQKSGRLADMSIQLLEKCGISLAKSRDQLLCRAQNFPLDIFLVRDDDIPAFLATDVCQLGILGQNGLLEKQALGNGKFAGLRQLLPLGYGRCRLSIAVPHDFDYQSIDSLNGKVIATSYKGLLAQYLADVICDLVSTGSTLVSNGLVEKDIILQSQAVLVTNQIDDPEIAALAEKVTSRIKAVLRAENSRYIMLNSPIDSLEAIKAVLPGSQSPTVMPLQGRDDMVAVHAVCEEGVFWDTMEDLKANGANSILVVPIEKMLD